MHSTATKKQACFVLQEWSPDRTVQLGACMFPCLLWQRGCWASSGLSLGPSRKQYLKGVDGHWNACTIKLITHHCFPYTRSSSMTLALLSPICSPLCYSLLWKAAHEKLNQNPIRKRLLLIHRFVSFLTQELISCIKHFLTPCLYQHYNQSQLPLPARSRRLWVSCEVVLWELAHQPETANILQGFLLALRASLKGIRAEVCVLLTSAMHVCRRV